MGRTAWIFAAALAGWRCAPPDHFGKVHGGLVSPRAVVAADLDGDGDQDVVVAESGAGRAALFVGNGHGNLDLPRALPAGPMPSDVRAADVEPDGDLDLIFANHETSQVTVLRNDGHAGFIADPPLDAGSRPHHHSVAAADLDGDGALDLAFDSSGDDTVRILLGSPSGFAPPRALAVCAVPYYALGAADVSGDGVAELLVPCQRSRTLVVVGAARDVVATVQLPLTPWVTLAADVDGEPGLEIIVLLDDAVAVLRGNVQSGFYPVNGSPFGVPGATAVAAGDLNGDGVADLAVAPWDGDEVTVILGGGWGRIGVRIAARPIGLAIVDLDRNGRAELVAASALAGSLHVVKIP